MRGSKVKDPVQDAMLEEIKWLGERARAWQLARDQILPLAQKLKALGAEVSFSFSVYISASGNGKLLTKLVRLVRTHGYHSYSERPKPNSSSWTGNFYLDDKRLIKPTNIEDSEWSKMWPSITIGFTSTVCKQVQTGTETKEVPVIETVCDSLEIDEELKDSEAA